MSDLFNPPAIVRPAEDLAGFLATANAEHEAGQRAERASPERGRRGDGRDCPGPHGHSFAGTETGEETRAARRGEDAGAVAGAGGRPPGAGEAEPTHFRITDYPTVPGTHRTLHVGDTVYRVWSEVKLDYAPLAAVLRPLLGEDDLSLRLFLEAAAEGQTNTGEPHER
jgi:hypothetical protein